MGLLSILEEESMFPKATDKTFEEKLNNNHLGKSRCFIKPKPPKPGQPDNHFAIVHYAGTVSYNLTGWLEKNKDPLNDTVVDQLKKASNALTVEIFADHPGQSGDAGGKGILLWALYFFFLYLSESTIFYLLYTDITEYQHPIITLTYTHTQINTNINKERLR